VKKTSFISALGGVDLIQGTFVDVHVAEESAQPASVLSPLIMTAPLQSALVILNSASGAGGADAARESITSRLQQSNVEVEFLTLEEGLDLAAEVRRHVATGVTLVIAGGGDGTVNAVGNAILGLPVRLGVLPLGTLNHFARDLGIPLDLEAALDVVVAGHTMPVDAAEVNGRIFINNSSVGLYPRIVRLRERYQRRRTSKWIIAAWATLRVMRTGRPLRVQLTVEGAQVMRTTPLVFIGNNAYRMAGFEAGSRESLQGGTLALYVVKTTGRWRLLRLFWRILARTAQRSGELAMLLTPTATIDVPGDASVTRMEVATDGEVVVLDLPLVYRSLPGVFDICVPT
jgi:YegS/Rv2252/BmrU family lipid kinase